MFKKTLTSLILTLVAFGGFFGVSIHHDAEKIIVSGMSETHAACADGTQVGPCPEDAKGNPTADAEMRKMYDAIVGGLNIILSMLTIIVAPAVMLASWLISPDWTSGDLFGIRPVMHDLWVVISNVTYFIYAILLIVIALATIFNSQNYGYKAMLPKLALGIILVPLTWWMVQFTISLATYITAAVITIPQETMFKLNESKCGGDSEKCWENRPTIPKNIVFKNVPSDATAETRKGTEEDNLNSAKGIDCATNKTDCYSPKTFLTNVSGTYGHLLVYAYSVFKISDVKVLPTGVDHIKSILEIIHQGFIGAIMFLVFGILVLALTFMLMMRAIKLWFYAIFSPIFTLHFVLGDGVFGDNKESFSIKEFLGLAFVPAVVGLALSFGLVIIGALQTGETTGGGGNCTTELLKTTGGCQILGMMGNDNNKIIRRLGEVTSGSGAANDYKASYETINEIIIGGITFRFYGNPSTADAVATDANSIGGVLSATGGILGRIIIDIIALVFIWVAFMAAKGVSKAVSAAVEPFEAMGKKIGDLGMKLPQYTPIPGTGGVSIAGANKVVSSAADGFIADREKKTYDSPLAKAFGVDNASKEAAGSNAILDSFYKSNDPLVSPEKFKEMQAHVRKVVGAYGLGDPRAQEALKRWTELLKSDKNQVASGLKKELSGTEAPQASGIIKKGGLAALTANYNDTVFNGVTAEDEKNWKSPNKGGEGKSTTTSTANNTFNIINNGGGKYSLDGTNFKLSPSTPEEIMKELNKSIKTLINVNVDDIKKELKEMNISDSDISKLIEKIEAEKKEEEKKKKSSGSDGGSGSGGA